MESFKDWKTIKKDVVYDNPWISLEHHQVINPNGNPGIYGKVCFKNQAIAIIPIDEEGNTWIIGQYRYTLDEYSWELPMGGGPLGEAPLRSAQRELKEETGIIAGNWKQLMKVHTSNCVTDEVGYVYVATELSFGSTEFDDTENLKVKKIPFKTLVDMVIDGKITDSISIAGILRLNAEWERK